MSHQWGFLPNLSPIKDLSGSIGIPRREVARMSLGKECVCVCVRLYVYTLQGRKKRGLTARLPRGEIRSDR